MIYSDEQQQIIDFDHSHYIGDIVYDAKAGSGKSFIILEKCKQYPSKKILVIAYTSVIAKEMSAKVASLPNVESRTMHSLAWDFGKNFSDRLGNLSIRDLEFIPLCEINDVWIHEIRELALLMFLGWCKSHLDVEEYVVNKDEYAFRLKRVFGNEWVDKATESIKLIIAEIEKEDSKLLVPHDYYLKLYHDSKPLLDYDIIYVDEAQDINMLMYSFVRSQDVCRGWVGDNDQNIFAFNETINAMELVQKENDYTVRFTLSQSFRCSTEIASLANPYLELLGNEENSFRGWKYDSDMSSSAHRAVIGRSIYSITMWLHDLVYKEVLEDNKSKSKIYFIKGLKSLGYSDVFDIFKLMGKERNVGKSINFTSAFIGSFANFKELLSYAKETGNKTLSGKILIAQSFISKDKDGLNFIDFVNELKAMEVTKESSADYTICTAHKAKGLEWEKVILLEDFFNGRKILEELRDGKTEAIEEKISNGGYVEDIRLLYVAITRAKRVCEMPDSYKLERFEVEELLSILR